jgi:hypothetical protein
MKKIKQLLTLCFLATSLFASTAQAQQWCTGKVMNILTDTNGVVMVVQSAVSGGGYVQFCNINAAWKGVSPALCANWLGYVRSAVARKSDMIFFYNEPTACPSIPTGGNAPAPGRGRWG